MNLNLLKFCLLFLMIMYIKSQAQLTAAMQVAKQMQNYYVSNSTSAIDLQKNIKNRGFSYLRSKCQQQQIVVQIGQAQQFIQMFRNNLRQLLPQRIFSITQLVLNKWRSIPLYKMTKSQNLYSEKQVSEASFLGIYMKRNRKYIYIGYKVVNNAFSLAPDLYLMTETQNTSGFFGAVKQSSSRTYLVEQTRGFNRQDLAALMSIATFSLIDFNVLQQLDKLE